jgi:hypothetical protein
MPEATDAKLNGNGRRNKREERAELLFGEKGLAKIRHGFFEFFLGWIVHEYYLRRYFFRIVDSRINTG